MDYIQNKNTSFSANIRLHITSFIWTVIGYAFFSNLQGSEVLHKFTLDYINLFLNKFNYLDLGYALSISLIIITYFLITQVIYCLFNLTQYKSKSIWVRYFTEYGLSIWTSIWISWFAIALFSPYLEFTRETYNFYHVMLWVYTMLIILISMVSLVSLHSLFNTVWFSIPSFLKKKEKTETHSYNMDEYNPEEYNEIPDETNFVNQEPQLMDDNTNPTLNATYGV